MRLPPQASAVLRGMMGRPMRAASYRGATPASAAAQSVICPLGQTVCMCSNNTAACCSDGQCTLDSGGTGLCLCGSGARR